MKGTGDSTKPVDMANSGMSMATYLRVSGLMIRPMGMEFTFIRMEPGMKVSGEMIFSTDKEKKSGPTTPCMRASTMKARSTEKASTSGKMAPDTMETGSKIELKDSANTNGKMAGAILVNGKTIICMVKEFTLGPTVEDMKENTKWTKSTGSVFTFGLMVVSMRVIGSMVSNMDRANTCSKTAHARPESGSTEKGPIGSMKELHQISVTSPKKYE